MIKYFCDRCGREIQKKENLGFVKVMVKDSLAGDFIGNDEFADCMYCKDCIDGIKSFLQNSFEVHEKEQHKKIKVKKKSEPVKLEEKEAELKKVSLKKKSELVKSEEKEESEKEAEPTKEAETKKKQNLKKEAESTKEVESEKEAKPKQETAKPRKKIDIGKIMALYNAHWQVRDIADEMGMEPTKVSQAIYRFKKYAAKQS